MQMYNFLFLILQNNLMSNNKAQSHKKKVTTFFIGYFGFYAMCIVCGLALSVALIWFLIELIKLLRA